MDEHSKETRSIELLQQLGLKEYEARCFVALARLPSGTAKEISENSEVPRTRVYDATRVLESKGLVEIQHSSPQRFRAVPVEEATTTLRQEYEQRTDRLREALAAIEPVEPGEEDTEVTHEVWALSGAGAIEARTNELVDGAEREVLVVVGAESTVTDGLVERLHAARDRGVDLLVGTGDAALRDLLRERLPETEPFVSGLEWLAADEGDDTEITRLLLVDRETILVSTRHAANGDEQAVFGRGFGNGLVTIVRRLMATGLAPAGGPAGADGTGG